MACRRGSRSLQHSGIVVGQSGTQGSIARVGARMFGNVQQQPINTPTHTLMLSRNTFSMIKCLHSPGLTPRARRPPLITMGLFPFGQDDDVAGGGFSSEEGCGATVTHDDPRASHTQNEFDVQSSCTCSMHGSGSKLQLA